ncbi:MAG: hypothetical protein Q9160_006909 [Pyrenula sp. 1 TL-2023]
MFEHQANNKTIDLSRTFRLSGLSSGAKLQLVQASRSPSVVSIAVQLPEGPRLVDKFPSDTTIWQVLRRFEEGAAGGSLGIKCHITDRGVPTTQNGVWGAGRLVYQEPVLQVVGRTLSSFTDLQKTLGQLGFNDGSVMMRLSFSTTDTPMEEAIRQQQQYFTASQDPDIEMPLPPLRHNLQSSEQSTPAQTNPAAGDEMGDYPPPTRAETQDFEMSEPPGVDTSSTVQPGPQLHAPDLDPLVESISSPPLANKPPSDTPTQPIPSDTPQPSTPTATDTTPQEPRSNSPSQPPSSTSPSSSRPFTTYLPPSTSTPLATLTPHNPNDYIPTIEHARTHQSHLKSSSLNRRLPTDAELHASESARQATLSQIPSVSIRVRFPNQEHIETTFSQSDTARTLYTFVREHVTPRLKNEAFRLKITDVKKPGQVVDVPDSETKKLIKDLELKGRVLVIFAWDEEKASPAARATRAVLREEDRAVARKMVVEEPVAVKEEDDPGVKVDLRGRGKDEAGEGGEGKKRVPKWMQKLVKK